MSPRPAPTRTDPTAERFLQAGVRLVDAALSGMPANGGRLKAFRFPAALEWLRVEDVVRLAQADGEPDSKRAFRNRWPSKDDFIGDLCLYGLTYADVNGQPVPVTDGLRETLFDGDVPFSARIARFTASLTGELVANPRSYLLSHIAPLLVAHPPLHEQLVAFVRADVAQWGEVYVRVLTVTGFDLRPGWDIDCLALSLQAMIDGFVLRHRIDPEHSFIGGAEQSRYVAQAVLALLAGAIDFDRTGLTTAAWVDRAIVPPAPGN